MTPYGYKPLPADVESEIRSVNAIDSNKKLYSSINVTHFTDEVVYSEDIISDIVLNSLHTEEGRNLAAEVTNYVSSDSIRHIASNNFTYNRKLLLLRRKAITRDTKKITRIILEKQVDMSVQDNEIMKFMKR